MTRRFVRHIQAGFALTLLAIAVVGGAALRTAAVTNDSAAWVAHTLQVEAQLDEGAALISSAEDGAMGYVLTADTGSLAVYTSARIALPAVVERVRVLTADNPSQELRADSLAALTSAQLKLFEQIVGPRAALEPATARSSTEREERQGMARIRRVVARMRGEEQRLQNERSARLSTVTRQARVAAWAGILLALAAVSVAGAMISRELRQRQRAEAALAASESHYRTVLNNVTDAVFVTDTVGRYLDVNPQGCELTGYSRAELLRLTAADTYLPEERPLVAERIAAVTAGRVLSYDRRMLRKDGSVILIEVTAVLLPDGRILTTFRDLSEQRKVENQIRESEQRFRELAENVREVFFSMDPATGRVQYVSPSYEELFGHSREHAYATPHAWTEGIHPDDRDQTFAADRLAAESGVQADSVYRIVRPDGSTRWVRGRSSPVRNAKGEIIRVVGIAEDITDLKRTEAQSLQSAKMEAVGRLAGGIAHDFNNLLTVIMSYGQLQIDEHASDDPRRPDLEQIVSAARRAADLTKQLLAFSRRQVLQPQVLDLSDLVMNLTRMLERVIGENIELRSNLTSRIGCVRADSGGIEQIIMNLVVNARDAMPSGGTVTIETANVEMNGADVGAQDPIAPGSYVLLAVSDTGEGLEEAIKGHLFEPFFTTKERGKGTGLGLSTVYGIVKQSGGYVVAESERGRGATFKVYLPRIAEPAEALPPKGAHTDIRGGSETIMLVEDEAAVRQVTRTVLERRGYTVIEADRPESAIALADSLPHAPNLVVTDVVLPGISGRELAGLLEGKWPGLKVLYLSGHMDDAIARHGVLERGVALLEKPFTPDALALKVRQVLDSTGRRSSPSGA
jgi:two-component system cell cycle sensor histidine kinase/response regulator CckA